MWNVVKSSSGTCMPHDKFSFIAFLAFLITPAINSMVFLKRIACFAELIAKIVNDLNNLFLFRRTRSVKCR